MSDENIRRLDQEYEQLSRLDGDHRREQLGILSKLREVRYMNGELDAAVLAATQWLDLAADLELTTVELEEFGRCSGLIANRDFFHGRKAEGLERAERAFARTTAEGVTLWYMAQSLSRMHEALGDPERAIPGCRRCGTDSPSRASSALAARRARAVLRSGARRR